MIAYTSGHWALGVLIGWPTAALAVAAVHHRIRSGQWRPYSDDQLNNQ